MNYEGNTQGPKYLQYYCLQHLIRRVTKDTLHSVKVKINKNGSQNCFGPRM